MYKINLRQGKEKSNAFMFLIIFGDFFPPEYESLVTIKMIPLDNFSMKTRFFLVALSFLIAWLLYDYYMILLFLICTVFFFFHSSIFFISKKIHFTSAVHDFGLNT